LFVLFANSKTTQLKENPTGREILVGLIGASWCLDQSYSRFADGTGDMGGASSATPGRWISIWPNGRITDDVLGRRMPRLSSDMAYKGMWFAKRTCLLYLKKQIAGTKESFY
jgi:hypothetical protein